MSGTPAGQSPTLSSAGVKENLCPPCARLLGMEGWQGCPCGQGLKGALGPREPGGPGMRSDLKPQGQGSQVLKGAASHTTSLPCSPHQS